MVAANDVHGDVGGYSGQQFIEQLDTGCTYFLIIMEDISCNAHDGITLVFIKITHKITNAPEYTCIFGVSTVLICLVFHTRTDVYVCDVYDMSYVSGARQRKIFQRGHDWVARGMFLLCYSAPSYEKNVFCVYMVLFLSA